MSDKGGVGLTVISHDSESRTHVNSVSPGCGSAVCYSKDVTYTGVSTSQLAALTRVSQNCEQFIKFEYNRDIAFIEDSYAWWVSRDGTRMNYWGGASGRNHMCACGVTNSCSNRGQKCNWYNGGSGWREDSGLLTDKSTLPVTQIRLGDLEDSREEGYHTLGKLKCYGKAWWAFCVKNMAWISDIFYGYRQEIDTFRKPFQEIRDWYIVFRMYFSLINLGS